MAQLIDPNKCGCSKVTQCVEATSSTPTRCLELCDIYVSAANSVGPCSEAGTIPISDFITLPATGCDSPTYTIKSYTNNLTGVSINSTEISFTSNWVDETTTTDGYQVGTIVYEVDCGLLKNQATVTIVFQQLNVECAGDYNPCNGACIQTTGGTHVLEGPLVGTFGPHASITTKSDCVDPIVYSLVSVSSADVIGGTINGSGEFTGYTLDAGGAYPQTFTVDYTATACGVTAEGTITVIVDLCSGQNVPDCQYCEEHTGILQSYPAKAVNLTSVSPTGLVDTPAIDVNENVTWASIICSDALPATLTVNYDVIECGVTTSKSKEVEVECPVDCNDCPVTEAVDGLDISKFC